MYLYKQFVNSEFDRKIFEESNAVLSIIISKNKKSLQSSFRDLFPYWFLQMNDPSQDVATHANAAFDKVNAFNESLTNNFSSGRCSPRKSKDKHSACAQSVI